MNFRHPNPFESEYPIRYATYPLSGFLDNVKLFLDARLLELHCLPYCGDNLKLRKKILRTLRYILGTIVEYDPESNSYVLRARAPDGLPTELQRLLRSPSEAKLPAGVAIRDTTTSGRSYIVAIDAAQDIGTNTLDLLKNAFPELNWQNFPEELMFVVKGVGARYNGGLYTEHDFRQGQRIEGFTGVDTNDINVAGLYGIHFIETDKVVKSRDGQPYTVGNYQGGINIIEYFYVPARFPIAVIPISRILSDNRVLAAPEDWEEDNRLVVMVYWEFGLNLADISYLLRGLDQNQRKSLFLKMLQNSLCLHPIFINFDWFSFLGTNDSHVFNENLLAFLDIYLDKLWYDTWLEVSHMRIASRMFNRTFQNTNLMGFKDWDDSVWRNSSLTSVAHRDVDLNEVKKHFISKLEKLIILFFWCLNLNNQSWNEIKNLLNHKFAGILSENEISALFK